MMFEGIPPQMILDEFSQIRVWREMRVSLISGNYQAFYSKMGYQKWNPCNE